MRLGSFISIIGIVVVSIIGESKATTIFFDDRTEILKVYTQDDPKGPKTFLGCGADEIATCTLSFDGSTLGQDGTGTLFFVEPGTKDVSDRLTATVVTNGSKGAGKGGIISVRLAFVSDPDESPIEQLPKDANGIDETGTFLPVASLFLDNATGAALRLPGVSVASDLDCKPPTPKRLE
jgi:hypothetical protein